MVGGGKVTRYYSKFQILKLPDLYKLEIAKFAHSFLHKSLPSSFSNFFIISKNVQLGPPAIKIHCISLSSLQIVCNEASNIKVLKCGTLFHLKLKIFQNQHSKLNSRSFSFNHMYQIDPNKSLFSRTSLISFINFKYFKCQAQGRLHDSMTE